MIPTIKNGEKQSKNEITIPASGPIVIVKSEYMPTIFTNGPIFPV
jgi:hypothetical protein